jgi:nicotinamide mononucleotide transporter
LTAIIDQLYQQDALEWIGLLTGLLYIFLAVYEKPVCWVFGIISSACIAWKSFTEYFLIADGFLQLFYVGIGVMGLIQWLSGAPDQSGKKPIITSPLRRHLIVIGLCLVLSYPVSIFLIEYADARYGYPDTLLTLLSVWATILLVKKDLHTWAYWIAIDLVYTLLYWLSDGFLFAVLFLVYTLMAVSGLWRWRQAV